MAEHFCLLEPVEPLSQSGYQVHDYSGLASSKTAGCCITKEHGPHAYPGRKVLSAHLFHCGAHINTEREDMLYVTTESSLCPQPARLLATPQGLAFECGAASVAISQRKTCMETVLVSAAIATAHRQTSRLSLHGGDSQVGIYASGNAIVRAPGLLWLGLPQNLTICFVSAGSAQVGKAYVE